MVNRRWNSGLEPAHSDGAPSGTLEACHCIDKICGSVSEQVCAGLVDYAPEAFQQHR